MLAAHNEKGEVTGVQRIYLDEKTGGKNTFMDTVKLSKGKIDGSAGILQKGLLNGQVYLAEGIETGASIAMANPKATVLVSFGISNLKNLSELIKRFKPMEVIIAADNDLNAQIKTLEETKKAQAVLSKAGLHVTIKMPHSLPNKKKTDWNDVHREKGVDYLKKELGLHHDSHVINAMKSERISQRLDDKLLNNINLTPSEYRSEKLRNESELSSISNSVNEKEFTKNQKRIERDDRQMEL